MISTAAQRATQEFVVSLVLIDVFQTTTYWKDVQSDNDNGLDNPRSLTTEIETTTLKGYGWQLYRPDLHLYMPKVPEVSPAGKHRSSVDCTPRAAVRGICVPSSFARHQLIISSAAPVCT